MYSKIFKLFFSFDNLYYNRMFFRLINLYNKNSIKIDSDNLNNYDDIIKKYHDRQEMDKLYLYNFTKYDKYLSLYDNNKKLTIHKIENPMFLIFLLKFYGIKRTKHQIKNSIIKNSENIFNYANKNPNIFNHVSGHKTKFDISFKNKLYNNLTKLHEKCKDKKTCSKVEKYIYFMNQKGGYNNNYSNEQVYDVNEQVYDVNDQVYDDNRQNYTNERYKEDENINNEDKSLISKIWGWFKLFIGDYIFPIYTIEQVVYKYYPGWPSTILVWSLEIIDFVLTVASIVIGVVFPPIGLFLDIINLVYNIFRFDIIGIIVSLVGFITYLGDAISAVGASLKPVIKFGGKSLFKFLSKFLGKFLKPSIKIGAKTSKKLTKIGRTAKTIAKSPIVDESLSYVKDEAKGYIQNKAEDIAIQQGEKYGEQLKSSIYGDEEYYYDPYNDTQNYY